MDRDELKLLAGLSFIGGFIIGRLSKRQKRSCEMPAYCEVWLMGNKKGH